jgi:hypothetical protein
VHYFLAFGRALLYFLIGERVIGHRSSSRSPVNLARREVVVANPKRIGRPSSFVLAHLQLTAAGHTAIYKEPDIVSLPSAETALRQYDATGHRYRVSVLDGILPSPHQNRA